MRDKRAWATALKRGNRRWRRGAVLAPLVFVAIALQFHASGDVAARRVRVSHAYGELPLSFEPNVGQAPGNVDYLARSAGFSIYLSRASATLALAETRATATSGRALRINLEGADRDAKASASVRLPGVSNYFIGSNPRNWHRGVPTFAQVKYRAYPGIGVVYHGQNGRVEFDFEVAAGANPSRIVMEVDGADDVNLSRDGDTVMRVGRSSIVLRKPKAWQTRDGLRHAVDVRYQAAGRNRLAFALGGYDRRIALTIDPAITYSSYIGGSFAEANAIAVDPNGNAYIAGWAADDCASCANPFPTTEGPAYAGGSTDAFVLALNSTGTAVVYSTLIGGSDFDLANSIAVDSTGAAYVAGYTQSSDFARPTNTSTLWRQWRCVGCQVRPGRRAVVGAIYRRLEHRFSREYRDSRRMRGVVLADSRGFHGLVRLPGHQRVVCRQGRCVGWTSGS